MASPPRTTNESDLVFTIQTDTVLESTTTSPSPTTTAGSLAATITACSTPSDFVDEPGMMPSYPYCGTCSQPMMTGDRPFWASSGYDPFDCGAQAILLNWDTYCCKGLMIDTGSPLGEMCFENIRCCSDDPDITNTAATTCSIGTPARLIAESSVSSAFYATQTSSTTGFEGSAFSSSRTSASPIMSSSSSGATFLSPSYASSAPILILGMAIILRHWP